METNWTVGSPLIQALYLCNYQITDNNTGVAIDRKYGIKITVSTRAVIDTARIDESTKKPYRLSILKKAQRHIDSYAN